MRVLHFGAVTDGEDGSWGKYALHLQCPWRLDGPAGTVTGQDDLWEHATLELPPDDWSFEHGDSLQDARLGALLGSYDERTRSWINSKPGHLVVMSVDATDYGDLTVEFSGGYTLRVFPASSRGEFWRLFVSDSNDSHFVVRPEQVGPSMEEA
jgi:hypothetical protein